VEPVEVKMSKKRTRIAPVVALAVMGIAVLGLSAAVYAKYIASIQGKSASAEVAKWAFKEENESKELTCDLSQTYNSDTLVAGKIAPGTKGTCNIELSNANSEVGVNYTITIKEVSGPQNLVFKYGSNVLAVNSTVTGKLKVGGTKTVSISWAWPYETDSGAGDTADTIDGRTAADNATTGTDEMKVTFDVTGVQTKPTKAPQSQGQ